MPLPRLPEDIDASDIALENIPIVLALLTAIIKIVNAKEDERKQLDALQDAAEAVKERMDEVKFPEEARRAKQEG